MKKIVVVLTMVFFLSGCAKLTDEELRQVTNNGSVVLNVLENYKNDNNKYPDNLDELVPKYLKEIPSTGIKDEHFWYTRISQKLADDYCYGFELFVYDANKFIVVGSREMNRLVYYPSKKYPQRRFEKTHKVINGWAYQTVYRNYGKPNTIVDSKK